MSSNQTLGAQVQQVSGSDVAGLLTGATGATSASVVFNAPYSSAPVVIISPIAPGNVGISLSSVSRTGFTLAFGPTGPAVSTGWHAIGNPS